MKHFFATIFSFSLTTFLAIAQNAAPATDKTPAPPINVTADRFEFDSKKGLVIHSGNVKVTDGEMKIACGVLTVKLPVEGASRVESIIAERDVVLEQSGSRATAEKAIYTFSVTATATNDVIELRGNPVLETPEVTIRGDVLIYDRVLDTFVADKNIRTTFRPGSAKAPSFPFPGMSPKKEPKK